jgi:hypothetical protein
MSAKSTIEKPQKIAREKEEQKSEHKRRQEEEVKLLKRIEVEEELRRAKKEGLLNIQLLVVRLPPYSSSSSDM